jgi:hypothetical protein
MHIGGVEAHAMRHAAVLWGKKTHVSCLVYIAASKNIVSNELLNT